MVHAFHAENGINRIERPIGRSAADTIRVAKGRASGVFGAKFNVIFLGAGIGGGADYAMTLAEGINRHRVLVFRLIGSSGDESGGRRGEFKVLGAFTAQIKTTFCKDIESRTAACK